MIQAARGSDWVVPLLILLLGGWLIAADGNRAAFLTLNSLFAHGPDALWSDLTVLGDTLVALCLLLLLLRQRPDLVVAVLLASLPAALLSHGLKDGLAIARPYAVLGETAHVIGPILKAGAFPSGHTTTAFVLATVLLAGSRSATAVGLLALATLVGLSRIAVGAHWPADVVGGMACGWVSGRLGLWCTGRFAGWRRPAFITVLRLILLVSALYLFFGYHSGYPLARPFEQTLALSVLVMHLLPGWRLNPDDGGR